MFGKWVNYLGTAGAIGLLAGSVAQARTVDLVDNNGVSSGWTATIPDLGDDASVQLSFVRSAGGIFYFNKSATFTGNSDPIVIEFDKEGGATAATLAIGTEHITNSTGSDWNGFRLILSNASANSGSTSSPAFTLGSSDGGAFNINPFTTMVFSTNNTELDVSGGTVANGSSWNPGSTTGTGLAILQGNDSTADRFLLKEIPQAGPGSGPITVPTPAAALTGLSTLLGLGVLKRVRRA